MAELIAVDYQAPDAAAQFVQSLRDTGFGVLKNHPIQADTLQAMYEQWGQFFQGEEKEQFLFDAEKFDGFFPTRLAETAKGHSVRDLKEYFHYYPWGRCPDGLKSSNQTYYDQAVNFASELLGWVEEHTPAEVASRYQEPLSKMIQGSEQSLLGKRARGHQSPHGVTGCERAWITSTGSERGLVGCAMRLWQLDHQYWGHVARSQWRLLSVHHAPCSKS